MKVWTVGLDQQQRHDLEQMLDGPVNDKWWAVMDDSGLVAVAAPHVADEIALALSRDRYEPGDGRHDCTTVDFDQTSQPTRSGAVEVTEFCEAGHVVGRHDTSVL